MKPEDVPDELVKLAMGGRSARDVRALLADVLPAHEAMVRAKIAEEIMQTEAKMGDGSSWDNGMRYAARIARGEA